MHVVICDHMSHIGSIKRCITRYLEECCADFTIKYYSSAAELLMNTDVISYSDLFVIGDEIPRSPVFKVVTDLLNIRPEAKIAFVTDSTELAFKGYRYKIYRCIRRSRMHIDLEECLNSLIFSRGLFDIYDRVRSGNMVKRIRISKIVYYESKNRKIFIIAESGIAYLREPYKTTLDRIEPFMSRFKFIRIHQSFLVNMFYIEKLFYDRAKLRGGATLPVSHQRARAAKEIYEKYLKELRENRG